MDGFADVDAAQGQWDGLVAGVRERVDEVGRLAGEVEVLRVSASDGRGGVAVEVNGSGLVTALVLGAVTTGWSPGRLSGEIMRVMGLAHVALARRVREIVASSVGSESESGRAVVAGLHRRLGLGPGDVEAGR